MIVLFSSLAPGFAEVSKGGKIMLKSMLIDTSTVPTRLEMRMAVALKAVEKAEDISTFFIIQFIGPVKDVWKKKVENLGISLYSYIPEDAFVIKAESSKIERLVEEVPEIKWIGPYRPHYKIDPKLQKTLSPKVQMKEQGTGTGTASAETEISDIVIQTFEPGDVGFLCSVISKLGGTIKNYSNNSKHYGLIHANVNSSAVTDIAAHPQVQWIERYHRPEILNDRATDLGCMNVENVWNLHDLTGTGQIIGHADTGLDNGKNDSSIHDDFEGRIEAAYAWGRYGPSVAHNIDTNDYMVIMNWFASKFTSSAGATNIGKVTLRLGGNTSTLQGGMFCRIYSEDSALPDNLLTNGISRSSRSQDLDDIVDESGGTIYLDRLKEVEFVFNPSVTISPSTDYWIILDCSGVTGGTVYSTDSEALEQGGISEDLGLSWRSIDSKLWYKILGATADWSDPFGHGTHTAGSIVGTGASSGGQYRGVAYEAKLVHQSVSDSFGTFDGIPLNEGDLFLQAYNDGARIHSNSWGSAVDGDYTISSYNVDSFMWDHKDMLIVFAAGNEGIDANKDGKVDQKSLSSPSTAKNCLSVGASENNRAEISMTWESSQFGTDPIKTDKIADNPSGIAAFSSRGPCSDYRIKPDLVAPGTLVVSCKTQAGIMAFSDTMESGINGWTTSGVQNTWALSGEYKNSGSYSWADSPGCNYQKGTDSFLVSSSFDTKNIMYLRFFTKFSIPETGYNGLRIGFTAHSEIQDSDLTSYFLLTGEVTNWTEKEFLIPEKYRGLPAVKVYFNLHSGYINTGEGVYVDDVRICSESRGIRLSDSGVNLADSDDNLDRNYFAGSGTSMAAPLAAGAAALARQFYTGNMGVSNPSAALIKATLVNGCDDLTPGQYGTGENKEVSFRPDYAQGWGRINLEQSLFPTSPRMLKFFDSASLHTGQDHVYNFSVTASSQLRVTLTWTDYPSAPQADKTLVNNLDLQVTGPDSTVYHGNGGLYPDTLNNLEDVSVTSPATGSWNIKISGTSVPQGPQPYALVISGACSFETSPESPLVSANSPTNNTTPTWTWSTGGGGSGTYRYKLDDSDFASGATEVSGSSYTPTLALTEGAHILYVQERNFSGDWSMAGSCQTVIDITPPDILSSSVEWSYSKYIDISFSEGVYANSNGSDGLESSDFSLIFNANEGRATGVEISGVSNIFGENLTGGEEVIRLFLSISGTANGNENIEVKPELNSIFDFAGNPIPTSTTTQAKTLFEMTPRIIRITSPNPDGVYGIGDSITVYVIFQTNVFITGNPVLKLEIGDKSTTAPYSGEDGTDVLMFSYSVQASDQQTTVNPYMDNDWYPVIDLSEGTLKDINGIDAAIINEPSGNCLKDEKSIVLDGVAPTVSESILCRNSAVYIKFSESVYSQASGSGVLVPENFNVDFNRNSGGISNVTISEIRKANGKELTGGESDILILLSVTGNSDGTETIEISPVNDTQIFDQAGNALTGNLTGVKTFRKPVFVNIAASGTRDGTSWTNAYTELYTALSAVQEGAELWIAKGTYKPTTDSDRTKFFQMKRAIGLFGGFAGNESTLDSRNWKNNATVLSGDIGTQNDISDNSYHVMDARSCDLAVIDGFSISGGNANGDYNYVYHFGGGLISSSNLEVSNCLFTGNFAESGGGGIYITEWSEFTNVKSTVFSNNSSNGLGGAVCNGVMDDYDRRALAFTFRAENCVFVFNTSNQGGGIYSQREAEISNCTFVDNGATDPSFNNGGAICNDHALTLKNSIFWANSAEKGAQIYQSVYFNVTYVNLINCDIQNGVNSIFNSGNAFVVDDGDNIDSDPLFVSISDPDGPDNIFFTLDDGLNLSTGSPCINIANPVDTAGTDILGIPRPQGAGIDMGAYERTGGDTVPPSVSSVFASTPDGIYRAGEPVTATVAFTESVVVTGNPRLAFNCGAGRYATFNGGSGSSTISFTYVILPGDSATDLDYPSTGSLELDGGTIKSSVSFTNASLTLPAPGGSGSLSANMNIRIDTAVPAVVSAIVAGDNSYMDVTFSEGVYTTDGSGGLTAGDFQYTFKFNAASGGGVTDFSVSTATRTDGEALQGGENTIRLLFSIAGIPTGVETIEMYPGGNSIFDSAGNPASVSPTTGQLPLNSQVGPTVVSISSSTPDGIYRASGAIAVTVTFSESVDVTGIPRIALNCGAGRYAEYSGGSGGTALSFAYIVQPGDDSSDLDYVSTGSLELNGGTILSTANSAIANRSLPEPGSAGSLGANKSIVVDAFVPTIQGGTLGSLNAYVELTLSEGIYGTNSGSEAIESSDLTLVFTRNGGGVTALTIGSLTTVNGVSLAGGETTVRVMLSVTGTPSGVETIEIRPKDDTSIFDKAGNAMAADQTTGQMNLYSSQVKTLVGISLSQNSATVVASAALNLGTITVTASYFDDTQSQVSGVVWTIKSGGGSISGTTYQAPSSAASVVLTCTYSESGVTKTANLAVTVTEGASNGRVTPAVVSSTTTPMTGFDTSRLSDGIRVFNGDFALRHGGQVCSITFDLGRTHVLTSVKHYNDGQYGARIATLETASAANSSTFTAVTTNPSLTLTAGTPNLDIFTVSSVSARYLRLRYTAYNDQTWFQLNEIEIYGTVDPTAVLSGIALAPSSLTLNQSESYDMKKIVATATYSDGSKTTAPGVSWGFKSGGGSLSDTIFTAPASAGLSTLTCSYSEGGVTKTADIGIATTADALEKRVPVSATSSPTAFKDYGVGKLYDGAQVYNSDFVVLNRGVEVLVTFDLGSDKQVSKVRHCNDGEYGANSVSVEAASADNPQVFVEAGNFDNLTVSSGAPNLNTLTLTPVKARYFRFRYTSFNNSFWFQANEIELLGTDPGASTLSYIALSPATIPVTASTTYDLSRVGVKAFYTDFSWRPVSAVTWSMASGSGSVAARIYTAPASPQTASLLCTYVEGAVSRGAPLSVSVVEAELEPLTIFGAACSGVPYPGYGVARLYDRTRTYNGDFALKYQNLEVSVVIDLGYDMKVTRVRHYNDGEYGATSLSLETAPSSTPQSFTMVKNVNGLTVTAGSSNVDTMDFTQVTTRYVKFRYYGFNDSVWFQVNEIEILGPSGQLAGTGNRITVSAVESSITPYPGYGAEKLIDGGRVINGDFACVNSSAEVSLTFDLGSDSEVGVIRFVNDGQWGAGSVTVRYATASSPSNFLTAQAFTGLSLTENVPALNTLTLSAPATGRYFVLQCGSFADATYFQANEVEFFEPPASNAALDGRAPDSGSVGIESGLPIPDRPVTDRSGTSNSGSYEPAFGNRASGDSEIPAAGISENDPSELPGFATVLDLTLGGRFASSAKACDVFASRGLVLAGASFLADRPAEDIPPSVVVVDAHGLNFCEIVPRALLVVVANDPVEALAVRPHAGLFAASGADVAIFDQPAGDGDSLELCRDIVEAIGASLDTSHGNSFRIQANGSVQYLSALGLNLLDMAWNDLDPDFRNSMRESLTILAGGGDFAGMELASLAAQYGSFLINTGFVNDSGPGRPLWIGLTRADETSINDTEDRKLQSNRYLGDLAATIVEIIGSVSRSSRQVR